MKTSNKKAISLLGILILFFVFGGIVCSPSDLDADGIPDGVDNCPSFYNPAQEDTDGDGVGDKCDDCPNQYGTDLNGCPDSDSDGIIDPKDNCPWVYNPVQEDSESFNQTITIRALIDGISQLIVRSNTVQWYHDCCAAPGRHLGADEPTYINGIPWMPWPEPGELWGCHCYSLVFEDLHPPLPKVDVTVSLNLTNSRWITSIVQYPLLGNNYTLIIEFDDGFPGGSDWYEVEIHVYGEGDGIGDVCDNCPFAVNPDQDDTDGNGIGDACENVTISRLQCRSVQKR